METCRQRKTLAPISSGSVIEGTFTAFDVAIATNESKIPHKPEVFNQRDHRYMVCTSVDHVCRVCSIQSGQDDGHNSRPCYWRELQNPSPAASWWRHAACFPAEKFEPVKGFFSFSNTWDHTVITATCLLLARYHQHRDLHLDLQQLIFTHSKPGLPTSGICLTLDSVLKPFFQTSHCIECGTVIFYKPPFLQ